MQAANNLYPPLSSRGFISIVGIHQIVCWGTLTYGVTVFSPAMAAKLGVSITTIMLVYAAGILFNGIVAPACTRWVMRGAALRPGLAGLTLGGLSCLVLSFASHPLVAFVGFAMAGAAMALTQYDFAWLLVRLHHPHDARRTVTGITLFGALASSIMWPIAHALNVRFGMEWGWRGLGLIMLVVGGACLLRITRMPVIRADAPLSDAATAAAPELPVIPAIPAAQFWAIIVGLTTISIIGGALAINLPLLLAAAKAEPAVIAAVLSLFGIGQLLGRSLDFLGARKFGLNATVVTAASLALLSWAALHLPQTLAVTAAAVLMLGASNGLFTIVRGATPLLAFHGAQFIKASAAMASIGSVARAAAPIVIAFLLERVAHFTVTAAICAAGILIGAALVLHNAKAALRA